MEKLLTYKKINEIFPKLIRILNKANQKNILFDCSFNTECKFMLPVEQFKKNEKNFQLFGNGIKVFTRFHQLAVSNLHDYPILRLNC